MYPANLRSRFVAEESEFTLIHDTAYIISYQNAKVKLKCAFFAEKCRKTLFFRFFFTFFQKKVRSSVENAVLFGFREQHIFVKA